ncbi:MAG: flagellar basal body P-ring formation chaperone FlgA [Helicobacter sp.]|nr:flagellar basal body P-ring formation chaperone FlgA [Helicobacter sp.]
MLPLSLPFPRLSPRPLLRLLLACSLVCCALASDKIEKRYEFSSNTIDSQLIMPDAPLFTLFELAPSANLYRAKSSVIVEKFKQHNITLIPTSTIVEFVRTQNDRMPFLEEKIGPLFVDEYAKYHILVQDVIVTPLNNVALEGLHFQDFQFPQKLQKRATGSFPATFLDELGKVKRIYFRYEIKATLEAIETTKQLKVGDVISPDSVNVTRIPFVKMSRELATKADIDKYSIASYTAKGTILHQNDLAPKIVIRRGDMVFVLVNDGRVILSFDGIAQQDGAVGKKIRVKNPRTNKSYDVIVIDEKRVEVR